MAGLRSTLAVVVLLAASAAAAAATTPPPTAAGDALLRRIPEDSLLFARALAHSNLDTVTRVVRRDVAEARRVGDRGALARLLRLEGTALVMGGDPAAGAAPLDEGLRLAVAEGDSATLLGCLRWRAYVAGVQGRFDEQERMARRLVATAVARRDLRYEAIGHNFVGWIAHRRGEHRRALAELTRAVQLERATHDLSDEAVALTALGSAYMALGQYDSARTTYLREIEIAREMGQIWSEAEATNDLGVLELQIGDPARAAPAFQRAYQIHRRLGESVDAVDALSNLAGCEVLLGRHAEAIRRIREGIAICERRSYALPLGGLINSLAEAEQGRGRFAAADSARRRVLDAPGQIDESAFVPAAIGHCDALEREGHTAAALDFLRSARARLRGRVSRNNGTLLDVAEAGLLLRGGRAPEARALARTTAAAAESVNLLGTAVSAWRIVGLAEDQLGHGPEARSGFDRAIADWEALRRLPSDPEWRERRGSQGAALGVDYVRLLLAAPGSREQRLAAAFDLVQRVKTRTLIERMSGPHAFSPDGPRIAPTAPVGLRAVQDSVLREGELLVEWLVAQDRSYRFAVSRESVQVDSAPGLRELQTQVQSVRGLLAARPGSGAPASSSELQQLAHTMWAGLEGPLARARRVIIAPDGPVHLVPFASLAGTERATPPSIVGVPSATVLAGIRREAPARRATHGLLASAPADRSLEGARREVEWLARQFRDVTTGASDTLVLFDLAGYDVLHLAGHSIVDDQFPWRSAIGASARERGASLPDSSAIPGGRAGPLRAETIASGHLDARLVVLSSCATAGGRVLTGEGVAGLSTAFLAAGTPTVLATLWPVDDRATERFMKEFYRGLGRGQGADAALATAQQRFRRDPATRHPFYWAGFVLLGEGDTRVPLRPRPLASIGPWVAIGIGLLLGATLLVGRTRRPPSA